MRSKKDNCLIMAQAIFYEEWASEFRFMGKGRIYTQEQKEYIYDKISEFGIRATARIFKIPRRTLQRWCRKDRIYVQRCPFWVYKWAEKRRKRREFWKRKGYF